MFSYTWLNYVCQVCSRFVTGLPHTWTISVQSEPDWSDFEPGGFRNEANLVQNWTNLVQNWPIWFKTGPIWFKLGPSGSKLDQSGSNWAHLVQNWTNLVQTGPIWFKTGPIWFIRIWQSGSHQIPIDLSLKGIGQPIETPRKIQRAPWSPQDGPKV